MAYAPGKLTIERRPVAVAVTGHSDTAVYDGAEHSVSGYDVEISDALHTESDFSFSAYTASDFHFSGVTEAKRTDAGTTNMGLAPINDNENFDVTFDVTDGYMEITPAKVTVIITGHFDTKPYNRQPQSVSGYDVTIDNDLYTEADFTFSGEAAVSSIDAGTTYMGLTPGQFANNNDNFDVTFDVTDGYMEITPITDPVKVTIIGNVVTADYDGEERSVSGYQAEADSDLYDVEQDFTFSGPQEIRETDAGEYDLKLDENQFENINANFPNVTFDVTDGHLTIEPIETTVRITGHHNTSPYDGAAHSVSGYDAQIEEGSPYKEEWISFAGTAEATLTNAGTVNMGLSAEHFSNRSDNFSSVTFEVTDGYQTITPISATVTVVGHTGEFAYDGAERSVEGYEVTFSTPLYNEDCFEFNDTAEAKRTGAGVTEMRLLPDSFQNVSPNFDDVTFEVTDGWVKINPVAEVSKTLSDALATAPKEFLFHLALTNADGNPVGEGWKLSEADGIATDAEGKADFTLTLKDGDTQTISLVIPLESSLTVTEDLSGDADANRYLTSVSVNGDKYEDVEALLDTVTQSQNLIAFSNEKIPVCRIEENTFQTIASAIEYAKGHGNAAVIEMLTDYVMPDADKPDIPANCEITLSTAPEYDGEGDGVATITRAADYVGAMFVNRGTWSLGDEDGDSEIILDGGADTFSAAMVLNDGGTVNVYEGATLRNAKSDGNGGAISGSGTVNVWGGTFSGNSAANGGAIYLETGAVNISGGSLTGNEATGNGGAVYVSGGTVNVTGGALSGNAAAGNGGAIYSAGGGVNVSGGVIGGENAGGDEESGDANTARNGAAIFITAGSASFSGGEITGNAATDGGAVGIGADSVRLSFSGSPKILDNTMNGSPSNIFLNQDSAHIINANGLDEHPATIGVYVPDSLYEKYGVSQATFGAYTNPAGTDNFCNDRTPGMKVQRENSWLIWGKPLKIVTRRLDSFRADSLPPANKGSNPVTYDNYYPINLENYVSDIAADSKVTVSGYVFACAFAESDTKYSDCLSTVKWDNQSGDWAFERDGVVTNIDTLILYFSNPAYISIANNTNFPVNLSSLKLNGIDAASNRYGFVVARNGATVEQFVPLAESDLQLASKQNVKLMFPGVRNTNYVLNGAFDGATEIVPYAYDTATGNATTTGDLSVADANAGFEFAGKTYNDDTTIKIVFGEATEICKIVELETDEDGNAIVKNEWTYASLQEAVEDSLKESTESGGVSNYDRYKVPVKDAAGAPVTDEDGAPIYTVKIEMLQDYLIPSGDRPNVPTGRNFTFTTAMEGTTLGARSYAGKGAASGGDGRAVISQDQGNVNSFITAAQGGPDTAITIEYLNFEGKQLSNVKGNGGVVNTKNCDVTIRYANFSNFTAQNGGAVYADFDIDYAGANHTLSVSNAVFKSCVSIATQDRYGGGAIWTNGEVFALSDSSFESCTATQQGGAVFHRIDGTDAFKKNDQGEIVEQTRFAYAYRDNSKTTVKNCVFLHCNGAAAGALEINGYHIAVSGCTFNDCQARSRNGGAFNAFLQDTAATTELHVEDCVFTNCFAEQNGGAFRTMFKETTVKGCTFEGNMSNGDGGGVAQTNGDELILDNCTIQRNSSGAMGGGVRASGNVTLRNGTTVTDNSLTTDKAENAAGIYIPDGKTLTIGPKDESDSSVADTVIVRGNTAGNGAASNLRLAMNGSQNKEHCVIIRSNLSAESELRVLNASAVGTKFGLASDAPFPTNMKAFQGDNNDLYGAIDRSNANGADIIWRGDPICKITDEAGNLLYFDQLATDPAVFGKLDNGSANADSNGAFSYLKNTRNNLKLYRADGSRYGDDADENTFCVKMLVETYEASKYVTTNFGNLSWQTIILTTADSTDTLYPYAGTPGTCATIIRTSKVGNNNLFNIMVNMELRNITLDGGSARADFTKSGNTRIVNMDPGTSASAVLTIGKGAVLQNAHTTGDGGGVRVNWGSSLQIVGGGKITNCIADGNGGGVYKDGGNGEFHLQDGSISDCEANNGGGVYIVKHNDGKSSGMQGGSIERCVARTSGGGVFVADTNAKAGFRMSGGAIKNNSASSVGGGIAVGGNDAKLYFSGDAVVYDNTKAGAKCNVELDRDRASVINVTANGLGADALIGVYVPDTGGPYAKRGVQDKTFGMYDANKRNLFQFVNDRNGLRGWHRGSNEVYWEQMHSLTVSKTVESDLTADSNRKFHFTVTLDNTDINGTVGSGKTAMTFTNGVADFFLKSGESKTALYIPSRLEAEESVDIAGGYEVEEDEYEEFDAQANGVDGRKIRGAFDETDASGKTVTAHVAEFTNKRKTGDLTVKKVVVSKDNGDKSKPFDFRVRLSDNYLSGEYGDVTFKNGVSDVFSLNPLNW